MKTKRNETPAKTVDRRQKVHSELSLDFQSGVLLDLGAPRQGSFGQLRFTHSDPFYYVDKGMAEHYKHGQTTRIIFHFCY